MINLRACAKPVARVAALLTLGAASSAFAGYEYHVPVAGLTAAQAAAPAGPSLVGDGSAKTGACVSNPSACAGMAPVTGATQTGQQITVTGYGYAKSSKTWAAGKHYVEFGTSQLAYASVGICDAMASLPSTTTSNDAQHSIDCMTYGNYALSGYYYNNPTYLGIPPVGGIQTTALLIDMDSKTLIIRTNNNQVTSRTIPWSNVMVVGTVSWGYTGTFTYNFGQSNFSYAVPAGYRAGLW